MLVLLNPQARGGRARRLEPLLRAAVAVQAPQAMVAAPGSVADALALLHAQPRGGRVVLAGGDGTLHQMLPALLARELELGLIPAGSGDDSARAFGLRGWPWPRALAQALSAPAVAVDVGEVITPQETRPFVSSLGAGFDAAVAQRALQGPAWLRGMPRYLLATLREVAHLRRFSLRVSVDGQLLHEGDTLFASTLNTPSYGGGMPAVPAARFDDGRLDLLLAGRFDRVGTLLMLPRLLTGHHLGHPEVQCRSFTRLCIEADVPLPLAADGEAMAAASRVEVRVLPRALKVVVAG